MVTEGVTISFSDFRPETMTRDGERRQGYKWAWCVLLALPVLAAGCQSEEKGRVDAQADSATASAPAASVPARTLAERHCGSCHQLPRPELLTRSTWKEDVLPRMAHRLGLYEGERPDSLFESGIGGKVVRAANVFPTEPVLTQDEWQAIVDYYLKRAPTGSLPQPESVAVEMGLEQFRLDVPSFRRDPPMTSLLHIGAEGDRVYVGDANPSLSTLNILNSDLEELEAFAVESPPSSLRRRRGNLWVTLIGSIPPTDAPIGSLVRIDPDGGTDGQGTKMTLLDSLQRPVHAAYDDLNGDGREDVIISEFGYRTGALAWHERGPDGRYQKHVLRDGPGAVRSVVRDFNKDGRPDIMALFGQGKEALYIFYNEGDGHFREEQILEFPPSYGSVYFEITDFNGDSRPDILYVNGDNADYTPIMKGYHGVRIFLNQGDNEFEQRLFYHLDGAYKAIPRDYDGDGDLDIAVIAFFADYQNSLTRSFVFLENTGALTFEAHSFKEASIGAWLVADAGDLDEDGDDDLLLGAYSTIGAGSDYVPSRLRNWWIKKGPSLALLENTTTP
jgi:hypothetical protein